MPNTSSAINAMKKHVATFKRGKANLERLLKQQERGKEHLEQLLKQQEKWIASAEATLEQLERDTRGN